jgi:hypothetical protein
VIRRISSVLAVCALLVLATGPALAGGKVVVSADGHTWATALSTPLFDPSVSWVPGDERTASIYVGNRSEEAGKIAVVAHADLTRYAESDIDLQVRRASGAWAPLAADGQAHALAGADLAPGADVRVSVRAAFDPQSPNASQLRRLPISFDVVLSQAETVASPADDGSGDGALPDTGGVQLWVLVAGLLLILFGAVTIRSALAAPVRKEDDHDHISL